MYRDDVCAVCGEALPPDHLYCREHAANVDERLRELGTLLRRAADDLPRLGVLLRQVAPETYDWLAERHGEDADWPPAAPLQVRLVPEDVDVDVDAEPGRVSVRLRAPLADLLAALGEALDAGGASAFADACAAAEGANATH